MSVLASLPSEMLHNVFIYILDPAYGSTADRYRAFAGLAKSCRTLNSISTQYLYARYESPLEQPITGFLRHLAHNNELFHALKHIDILSNAGSVQRARVRKELVANIARLPEPYGTVWATEGTSRLAVRNELEMAILVLQATKLESLTMRKGAERAVRAFDDLTEPPLWLLPLSNVGLLYTQASNDNIAYLPYQKLHSLTLDLQHCNPSSLVHLFALPTLRILHVRNLLDHAFLSWIRDGGGWEDLNTYPNPDPWHVVHTPYSSVTTLVLENAKIPTSNIVWMITVCKQMRSFSATSEGNGDVVVPESRRWCMDILRALKVHRETLKHLRLDPDLVYPLLAEGYDEWLRVKGFKDFYQLESLDTTFSNLFGHPQGHLGFHGGLNGWARSADFLPEKCETLRVRFDGVLDINCDEAFLSLLVGDTPLRSLEVYYHYGNMFLNSTLMHPMNFWDVQRAFRKDGRVEFNYSKGFDLWGSELQREKFENIALRLADYGVKGVAMATHYEGYGDHTGRLEDKVLEYLGLDESWMSSEEGMMIMQ